MENENQFTFENPEYRKTYWHTCSHVMAQAVKRLWPEVQLAIGPYLPPIPAQRRCPGDWHQKFRCRSSR